MKVQRLATQFLLLSAVLAMVLTLANYQGHTEVLAAPSMRELAQSAPVINVSLVPNSIPPQNTGETFTIQIVVKTGTQQVSGVQAFLDFDPSLLEVVDANPDMGGTQIQGGPALSVKLDNSADNALGQINYAAGDLSAPFPSGEFELGTVTFRAKAPISGTAITMADQLRRKTLADFLGDPLVTLASGAVLGESPQIGPTEQVKLLINIVNAQQVSGIQFDLGFNNSVAKIANVSGMTPTAYISSFNDRSGDGPLTGTVAAFPAPGVESFTIAEVIFELVGPTASRTDLVLSKVSIADDSLPTNPLNFNVDTGQIIVGSSPPEITLTITVLEGSTTLPTLSSQGGTIPGGSVGGGSVPPAATPKLPIPLQSAAPTPDAQTILSQPLDVAPTSVPLPPSEPAALLTTQIERRELLPSQAADGLQRLGTRDAASLVRNIDPQIIAEIFGELEDQFALELIGEIGIERTTAVLSELPSARASSILALLDAGRIAEIVESMDADKLEELLPELPPNKLFQIPPQLLLGKLPQVPVEQLTFEIPPLVDPDLPPPGVVEVATGITAYIVPRTSEGGWVELASASDVLERAVGKFTKEIDDITVQVSDLRYVPIDVPDWDLDMVVQRYFQIEMENASSEDLTAVHLTFQVDKSWLQTNNIHKWSLHLARFDEELNQWVPFPTKRVQEDQESVTYTAVVPGFSLFAIAGSKLLPEPAFEVADLSITPSLAIEGEEVTITARVRNVGPDQIVYPSNLWLNDTIEESKQIRVEKGQTAVVTFVSTKSGGDYQVRLDRLSGRFSVGTGTGTGTSTGEAATSDGGIRIERNTLIIIVVGIVLGVSGLTFAALYLVRSRRFS